MCALEMRAHLRERCTRACVRCTACYQQTTRETFNINAHKPAECRSNLQLELVKQQHIIDQRKKQISMLNSKINRTQQWPRRLPDVFDFSWGINRDSSDDDFPIFSRMGMGRDPNEFRPTGPLSVIRRFIDRSNQEILQNTMQPNPPRQD